MSNDNQLLTVKELAYFLNRSPRWVYGNLNALPHVRIGRSPRFKLAEIEAWLSKGTGTNNCTAEAGRKNL